MEIAKEVQVRKSIGLKTARIAEPAKDVNNLYRYIKEEAGNVVFEYFASMGIFQNSNVIVLSANHYYSYDNEFMKDSNIIFNLKVSNRIDNINLFVFNLNNFLPLNGYYIGSFNDLDLVNRRLKTNKSKRIEYYNHLTLSSLHRTILSIPLISEMFSLLIKGKRKYLTSHNLIKLMDQNGFHVVHLKMFGDRTYFLAKKVRRQRKTRNLLNKLYLFSKRNYLIHN